ncbi:membrane protein YczE [Phytohabitans kaempferiae]|uniref:YitT family protein n=1 Tax=Phytohabitans kaempferiae TaxID=1620943 RepID=A0ABV6M2H4_9ACTN
MLVIERATRRLTQLSGGLVLYGASMALMIESRLGLDPWDVFHQGLSDVTGVRFGWIVILVGAAVLLLWIPLRQRPGLGTVANVVVVGLAADATLALLPTAEPMALRIAFLVSGVVLNGVATGLYIGARLGPGPRDGLMTGYVARRPGRSVRLVRTVIEVTVLAVGWLLGGTVGVGTVLYAVAIGPLAHVFIPLFTVPPREPSRPEPAPPASPTRGAPPPARAEPAAADGLPVPRSGQRAVADPQPVQSAEVTR